jgi:hypothetical protein
MFWKYIFPVILCFVFTLLFRQFVEFEFKYEEWKRPPRILVLFFLALGFVPIFNYFVALLEVILFIMILVTDGEDSFRIRELKDTKLNNWLFKS